MAPLLESSRPASKRFAHQKKRKPILEGDEERQTARYYPDFHP